MDTENTNDGRAMPRGPVILLPEGWEMRSYQEVWIVGQRSDFTGETSHWTLSGVFTSREKAIAACRDWTYFVGACNLDEAAPHEPVTDWLRDAHYPRGHERPTSMEYETVSLQQLLREIADRTQSEQDADAIRLAADTLDALGRSG